MMHKFNCKCLFGQLSDFVVWTRKSFLSMRVDRNDSFIAQMLTSVHSLWDKCVLPELMTRSCQNSDKVVAGCSSACNK